MKNPALTKLIALLLALISISMLVSGFYGLHAAAKDQNRRETEIDNLQNTIDAYHIILAELAGTEDYDSMTKELEELQKEQEEDSTKHRKDLAVYTATRGGLEKGQSALFQAESALSSGKMQYESGVTALEAQVAAFEKVYEQAMAGKTQLDAAKPILEAAEKALESLQKLLDNLHEIGDLLDLDTAEDSETEESEEQVKNEEDSDQPTGNEDQNPSETGGGPEEPVENEENSDQPTGNEDQNPSETGGEPEEPVENEENSDQPTGDEDQDLSDISRESEITDQDEQNPAPENNSILTGTQDKTINDAGVEDASEPDELKDHVPADEQEAKTDQNSDDQEEDSETHEQEVPHVTESLGQNNLEAESTGAVAREVPEEQIVPGTESQPEEIQEEEQGQQQEQHSGDTENSSDEIVKSPETDGDAETIKEITLKAYDTLIETYVDMVELLRLLQDCEIPVELVRQAMEAADFPTDELPEGGTIILISSEQITELEETLGMSMEEFGDQLRSERDEVGAVESINEDQLLTIRQGYSDNEEAVWRFAAVLEEKLPELQALLASAKEQIGAAEAALIQVESARGAFQQMLQALSTAGAQIEQGAQALEEGKAQLAIQQNNLDEQAEKLEAEKRKLDDRDGSIRQISLNAEEQKKLEDREKSLRMSLMAREEIKNGVLAGESLAEASEQWLDTLRIQTEHSMRQRSWASILLILSSVFALLALPLSLRTRTSRGLILLFTGLCLLSAEIACGIFLSMGRGFSYSALASGAIAAIQLLITGTGLSGRAR
ncbi:MAG: hypothetical protein K6C08_11445 [Oscillospiraceae bacterium]|nr:hypothetical protein [Oscillospiraceae bacterium]